MQLVANVWPRSITGYASVSRVCSEPSPKSSPEKSNSALAEPTPPAPPEGYSPPPPSPAPTPPPPYVPPSLSPPFTPPGVINPNSAGPYGYGVAKVRFNAELLVVLLGGQRKVLWSAPREKF